MLSKAITGANDLFDISRDQQRISFFSNFTNIRMLAFPHRNTVKFMGMKTKKHALIWRSKNGFFTLLSTIGELVTWSMVTGDILYSEKVCEIKEGEEEDVVDFKKRLKIICDTFEVFRGDENDNTWCANYNEHE